jgi:hypothetical protein
MNIKIPLLIMIFLMPAVLLKASENVRSNEEFTFDKFAKKLAMEINAPTRENEHHSKRVKRYVNVFEDYLPAVVKEIDVNCSEYIKKYKASQPWFGSFGGDQEKSAEMIKNIAACSNLARLTFQMNWEIDWNSKKRGPNDNRDEVENKMINFLAKAGVLVQNPKCGNGIDMVSAEELEILRTQR